MSKQKFTITAQAKDNKAIIRIDGEISGWNNHAAGFKAKLDALIAEGITDAAIYINSGGGNCFEANEIGNEISRFPGTLTAHLGALCASAVTYISSRCHKVIIAKNTSFMIHKPWGWLSGNSDDLKSYLKLLTNLEKEYLSVYSKKTGLTEQEIKGLWVVDYWMDSEEAIDKKFADQVEGEAEITDEDVEAIASYKGAPKIAATAKVSANTDDVDKNKGDIQNDTQTPEIMKENIMTVLALTGAVTEASILATITSLKAKAEKADEYKAKLDAIEITAKKEKAELVADAAITAKKIVAAQRDFYVKNLISDYDGTKAMIDAMPSAVQLTTEAGKGGSASSEDRSAWTYADYQDKNPAALAELAKNDEAKFKALFKAHYGKEI